MKAVLVIMGFLPNYEIDFFEVHLSNIVTCQKAKWVILYGIEKEMGTQDYKKYHVWGRCVSAKGFVSRDIARGSL